jgi:outer membrane protein TolC
MAEVAYREGRATILELLDAYGTYASARVRAIDLEGAARRGVMVLERAVGPRDPNGR